MWKLRWECSIASFSRAAGLARLTRVVLADVVLQLLVPKFFHQLTVFCAAHECILHLPADLVSPITTKFLMNPSNFVNKLLERMSSIHSAFIPCQALEWGCTSSRFPMQFSLLYEHTFLPDRYSILTTTRSTSPPEHEIISRLNFAVAMKLF